MIEDFIDSLDVYSARPSDKPKNVKVTDKLESMNRTVKSKGGERKLGL